MEQLLSSVASPKIFIVVGEVSGDQLAAEVITALRRLAPTITIEGVAGPKMIAAGCQPTFTLQELPVMGIVEVLAKLPRLLKFRRKLCAYLAAHPPDIYLGIDYTDFNLSVAKKMKRIGVYTIQYKGPSIWAWRPGRIKRVKKVIDLVFTIFPFENQTYLKAGMNYRYIGHPLADVFPLITEKAKARSKLQLPQNASIVALLPGSRDQELKFLAKEFIQTAYWCWQKNPNLLFVTSLLRTEHQNLFIKLVAQYAPNLPIYYYPSQAHLTMEASDVLLVASGTVTLEGLLLKCPMVVAYRLQKYSYMLAKWLIKVPFIALPNLLAHRLLIPEFIQDAITSEKLGEAILFYLTDTLAVQELQKIFTDLHQQLRCNAGDMAANILIETLESVVNNPQNKAI